MYIITSFLIVKVMFLKKVHCTCTLYVHVHVFVYAISNLGKLEKLYYGVVIVWLLFCNDECRLD